MDDTDIVKKQLEELFKKSPIKTVSEKAKQIQEDNEVDDTHDFVNKSLQRLMATTEEVVNEAAEVAKQTGEPEHFKAFAQVIKEMGKLTTNVLDILKVKKELEKMSGKDGENNNQSDMPTNNTTNVYITGSLGDALKKIEEEKGKIIDVQPIQEE